MSDKRGNGDLFRFWEPYLVDLNGVTLVDRFPGVKQWALDEPNAGQNAGTLRLSALVDEDWVSADVSFSQSYLASEESRRTIGQHLIEAMANVLQGKQ